MLKKDTLKLKIVFKFMLCFLITTVFLTGCSYHTMTEDDNYWFITFQTGKTSGMCYHMYEENLSSNTGKLIFQNKSSFPIQILLYKQTIAPSLIYEQTLNPEEIYYMEKINEKDKYSVGLKIDDTEGSKEGLLIVYDNDKRIPEGNEKAREYKKFRNLKIMQFIENLTYGCSI